MFVHCGNVYEYILTRIYEVCGGGNDQDCGEAERELVLIAVC